jgi:hypothetical protein
MFFFVQEDMRMRLARYLKAEMKRKGMTYSQVAAGLKALGLDETDASIANKLSRGTMSAAFLLSTLAALDLDGIQLKDLHSGEAAPAVNPVSPPAA